MHSCASTSLGIDFGTSNCTAFIDAPSDGGVPVYNVARPLLRRARPDDPPFRVLALGA